jgi:hypothetical protein
VTVAPAASVVAVDETVAVAAAHALNPPISVVVGETVSTGDGSVPVHH